jgi:hypothetical protein
MKARAGGLTVDRRDREPVVFQVMRAIGADSSLLRWTLLSLAVLAVVGHVCVLPTHAHSPSMTAGAGAEPSHDGHPAEPSVHAAFCDAALPGVAWAPPATGLMMSAPPAAVALPGRPVGLPASTTAPSPPLFLLHASLLI